MLKETMFLFLLIGNPTDLEEQYIGKIPNCSYAKTVAEKVKKTNTEVRGNLCLDSKAFESRVRFQKKPTPPEQKIVDDLKKLLPEVVPKPLVPIKRKE